MIDSQTIKKNLGRTVQLLRKSYGITQEKLSEHLNMQPQSITTIETGRTFVSSEALANLCNYFKVDPTIFFTQKTPVITTEENDYINKIKLLLPAYDKDKLKYIYEIMLILQK